MSDLTAGLKQIASNYDNIKISKKYAEGKNVEVFATPAIKSMLKKSSGDGKYNISITGAICDAVKDRLNIVSVTMPGDDKTTETIQALETVTKLRHKIDAAINDAVITGNGWLIYWPSPDGTAININVNPPEVMTMIYDQENQDKAICAVKNWEEKTPKGERYHAVLYYDNRIERYATNIGEKNEPENYRGYTDDGQDPILPNPYGVIPVARIRTGYPNGKPTHERAYGAQNAITKITTTQLVTSDYHGAPQRWRMINPDQTSSDIYDDEDDPTSSESTALKAAPGSMWDLQNTLSVGEFSAADPNVFLQPLNVYTRYAALLTKTPMRLIDPLSANISGAAIREEEAPFIAKLSDYISVLTIDIVDMYTNLLAMLGITATPSIIWAPLQRIDDAEGWATVAAKQAAGVPQIQTLTEAGYLQTDVETWAADSEETSIIGRIELLGRIAVIAKDLGTAVTLGSIDATQASDAITQLVESVVRHDV